MIGFGVAVIGERACSEGFGRAVIGERGFCSVLFS